MDRVWLKSRAKDVLRKNYFILLVISAIILITSGQTGGAGHSRRYAGNDGWYSGYSEKLRGSDIAIFLGENSGWGEYGSRFIGSGLSSIPFGRLVSVLQSVGFKIAMLGVTLISVLFWLLVAFPLKVGAARAYIDCADAEHMPRLGRLAYAFTSGKYFNILSAGFLRSLYTFLWSLLFVIPGIIKGYAYSMVPYIMADSPDMRASDAIRLSEEMMRGHKMEKFILDISFFGWYFLGMFAFGFGVFLVQPYVDATETQFYLQLRSGYITTEPVIDTRTYGGGYQN